MQYFTTFFDKNYLSRGLVLIESLQKHSKEFELYLLCLDDFTFKYFEENKLQFPQVFLLFLETIEKEDNELLACKTNRSIIEYYFTLSPCLPLYLLKKYNLSHICSLDADIKFYASPQLLFEYLINFSIIITPHNFSKEVECSIKYGKNNVSFQIFKNDVHGMDCLELWRKQCINWCRDFLDEENDRFADQKYLDNWETLYLNKVKVLNDNVSGLAPWNLNNYKITVRNNEFYSNNERIIFYHFHNNKYFQNRWATNGFSEYKVIYQKSYLAIYRNYWNNVEENAKRINIRSENLIRFGNIEGLKKLLLNEKTVFLRISKKNVIYIDFRVLNQFIKRIILRIYA